MSVFLRSALSFGATLILSLAMDMTGKEATLVYFLILTNLDLHFLAEDVKEIRRGQKK